MDNRYIGLIIGLVVGIIMIGSLMVPVLSAQTSETKIIENEGARYSLYEVGDTHTITFTADSMITDGVAQPLPDTSEYGSATVLYGTGIFRYHSDGNIRFWGVLSGSDVNRSLGSAVNVTITIDESGTALATSSDESVIPREFSNTVMYANPAGNYALSYNPYVVEDSTIYGCGNTVIEDTTYTMSWTGTVEGITVSWVYPPDQEIGTIEYNTTSIATNLLKVDSIVIPIESAGGDATYTYFFAPYEVEYDNPEYIGSDNASLVLVIPVIFIVSLVIFAVRFINRD